MRSHELARKLLEWPDCPVLVELGRDEDGDVTGALETPTDIRRVDVDTPLGDYYYHETQKPSCSGFTAVVIA
jgi:hypothetical protein